MKKAKLLGLVSRSYNWDTSLLCFFYVALLTYMMLDSSRDCDKLIANFQPRCRVNISIIVEIQAQHQPDRLKKPRTESVWTDRLGRVPSRLGPIG